MPLVTNFVNRLEDGVLLPSGQERQVQLRQIADAIIAHSGGRWLEVTNAAPTPVNIRAHASTVPVGVTNSATPAVGDQVTLYDANDPEIVNGYARMIRLYMMTISNTTYAIGLGLLDPVCSGSWYLPSASHSYAIAYASSSTPGYANMFSSSTSTGTTNRDLRCFVAHRDDLLVVSIVDPSIGLSAGTFLVYYPNAIEENPPRASYPYLTAMTGNQAAPFTHTPASTALVGGSPADAAWLLDISSEAASIPLRLHDFRSPLARFRLYHSADSLVNFGAIPDARMVALAGHPSPLFTIDLDGTTWLAMGAGGDQMLLVDVTAP